MKLKTSVLLAISTLLLYIGSANSHAAPCCSGSALIPSLITTDSKGQMSFRASQSAVIGNSLTDGSSVFRGDENHENTTSMMISAAYAVTPVLQFHIETGINNRYRSLENHQDHDLGWGDLSFGTTYEAVEQYRYSIWKPRVWIFLDITTPTGQSVYDRSQPQLDPLMTQVHGRGVWSLSFGAYALKTWQNWDAYFMAQHRRNLSRTVEVSGRKTSITLGATTALDSGFGYHWQLWTIGWRLGLSLGPQWEAGTKTKSEATMTEGSPRLLWNTAVQLSQSWTESWATTLAYADQTLLGPTYNAELSRAASLMVTHHFE